MGSATTQALEVSNRGLASTEGIDLQVASELFAIARVVGGSSHLSGALADPAAPAAARAKLVEDVFGSLSPAAVSLVKTAVEQRWSNAADLVDGIEELASARLHRGAEHRPRGRAVRLHPHHRRESASSSSRSAVASARRRRRAPWWTPSWAAVPAPRPRS